MSLLFFMSFQQVPGPECHPAHFATKVVNVGVRCKMLLHVGVVGEPLLTVLVQTLGGVCMANIKPGFEGVQLKFQKYRVFI